VLDGNNSVLPRTPRQTCPTGLNRSTKSASTSSVGTLIIRPPGRTRTDSSGQRPSTVASDEL
jgi:hypothetical protein